MTAPEQEERARRLAALRRSYARSQLNETDVASEPFAQFRAWFDDAVDAGLTEPNAMVLATASTDAVPSARIVLLKALDERGFVLFTQLTSRKGAEMSANPRASLVFPWFEIDRQVVVTGTVELVAREDVAAYFATRPRDSQLGAWASPQSAVLPDRATVDRRFADAVDRWAGQDVPVPESWGGFRVVPETVELWQGRESRLHDRLRYRRVHGAGPHAAGDWLIERLGP